MDVMTTDITKIPADNLRVPRVEFAALWTSAERAHDECVRQRVPDWYGAGVVVTCRWLARATVRPDIGPWYLADSPVTERTARAYPELIEAECLAAEKLAMRRPVPEWLADQPGWIEAVVATLNWAWRRTGEPPMELRHSSTG